MKLRFTRILMLSAAAAVAAACTCQGPRQTPAESQPEEETAAEEIVGEPITDENGIVVLELQGDLNYTYDKDYFTMGRKPEYDPDFEVTEFSIFMYDGEFDSQARFKIFHHDKSLVEGWSEQDLSEVLEMTATDAFYGVLDIEGMTLFDDMDSLEPLSDDGSIPGWKGTFKVRNTIGEYTEDVCVATTLKKYSVILMTAMTDEGGNLEGLSKALNGFSIRE